jgi:predicted metal-dependent peptidase
MSTVIEKPALSPAETARYKTRLAKAKTSLILEHPFVGSIAMRMPFELSRDVPTAATNGKRVVFNPDFIDKLSDEEMKFLVAHECFHPMLEHNFRRGERQARRWNMAADYVINQLLVDEGIGKMPSVGLLDRNIHNSGGGTSEGIYNILPEQPEGGGYGGDGDPLDDCEDGEGSPAEVQQQQAEWKVAVAQAAQAAKMMGKMSGRMQRFVDEVLQPAVDWRDVLRKFIQKCKADTRTWARPNRRFVSQGLYLPSASGETLGELLFAVDCSGSIGKRELEQYSSEIKFIKDDMSPEKIHIVYFDSSVSHYESYERDDALDIKPHGGGGTDFAPVFEYMQEHNINPVACVFLTDLVCDSFGDAPECPVLWVSNHSDKAPFGEVVMMAS